MTLHSLTLFRRRIDDDEGNARELKILLQIAPFRAGDVDLF